MWGLYLLFYDSKHTATDTIHLFEVSCETLNSLDAQTDVMLSFGQGWFDVRYVYPKSYCVNASLHKHVRSSKLGYRRLLSLMFAANTLALFHCSIKSDQVQYAISIKSYYPERY